MNSISPGSRVFFPPLGGSFLPRYALISQKALVSRVVHHGTAFLAVYAVSGSFRHGDFVFGSAGACMRSGQPFHEFRHERNITPARGEQILGESLVRLRSQPVFQGPDRPAGCYRGSPAPFPCSA
jgi:hypothetical protein